MSLSKKLLVVGGAGALGRSIVDCFARASWGVLSVGYTANEGAEHNFVFENRAGSNPDSSLAHAEKVLQLATSKYGKVNTVVCAAGGWAGGSIRDAETLANLADMHAKNTESAFLAAYLASHVLVPGGLLVLTGAAAALKATPGMVSYGASKAATHHLVASAVDALPDGATALGVLPVTIDTPMNRKYMADADFSSWTKVEDIADKVLEWSEAPEGARPPTGHLVTATTINNVTSWEDVGTPFQ